MRELRGLLLDLRRGASAFSRKAVLLAAAISAVVVLIALEKGDRKASTIKVSDVVDQPNIVALSPPASLWTKTPPPRPKFGSIRYQAVATDENAWNLLQRFFRDQADGKRVALVRKRSELYVGLAEATQKATYGITLPSRREEERTVARKATEEALRCRAALELMQRRWLL
jgi:hypothetical protein